MLLNSSRALIARLPARGILGCAAARLKHSLPDLPYDYNALEPYISTEIMKIHHSKHHATYVNNLNVVEEKLAESTAKGDIAGIVALQPAFKFHGGGHLNHSIFWQNMSPNGGGDPTGDLLDQINSDFGNVDNLRKQLSAITTAIQGSGWGWLGYNPAAKKLEITTCANQDPLQSTTGLVPLFGIDAWEHAYYLQYKNVRPDYVNAIWHVVNWKDVESRLQQAKI